jgi:hypothetical protein
MLWVYSASALAQLTLPLLIAAAGISIFKPIPFRWWLIGVGGASLFGLIFALLVATATCINVTRKSKGYSDENHG